MVRTDRAREEGLSGSRWISITSRGTDAHENASLSERSKGDSSLGTQTTQVGKWRSIRIVHLLHWGFL